MRALRVHCQEGRDLMPPGPTGAGAEEGRQLGRGRGWRGDEPECPLEGQLQPQEGSTRRALRIGREGAALSSRGRKEGPVRGGDFQGPQQTQCGSGQVGLPLVMSPARLRQALADLSI